MTKSRLAVICVLTSVAPGCGRADVAARRQVADTTFVFTAEPSRDAATLREVQAFPGIRDPQFLGDTVWAVTRDELDASYVSKFVVEWPSG